MIVAEPGYLHNDVALGYAQQAKWQGAKWKRGSRRWGVLTIMAGGYQLAPSQLMKNRPGMVDATFSWVQTLSYGFAADFRQGDRKIGECRAMPRFLLLSLCLWLRLCLVIAGVVHAIFDAVCGVQFARLHHCVAPLCDGTSIVLIMSDLLHIGYAPVHGALRHLRCMDRLSTRFSAKEKIAAPIAHCIVGQLPFFVSANQFVELRLSMP